MISVDRLSKNYGSFAALRDVSFRVDPGQVCGYLGPNGAGKSTTVRMLIGVSQPTSGSATVAGFDVAAQPIEVKRRVGYVPETGDLYGTLSCEEYLTLVGSLHGLPATQLADKIDESLTLFELSDSSRKRLDTLSKGTRQKVVLSAALLHDPEVLIFDEPLSGLDANAARIVKDVVRGLADRGKTVLYCSHVLDVVERLCDRVIILEKGEIVADGTPSELMAQHGRETLERVFRDVTRGERHEAAAAEFVKHLSQPPTTPFDLTPRSHKGSS